MKIFVSLPGQHDNVGDTLHRKVLLEWLRPMGDLHLYLGQAPNSFVSGLGVEAQDTLYTSSSEWVRTLWSSRSSRPTVAFNPGEIRLGSARAARETLLSPVLQGVRARGGSVIRIGIGAGNDWTFPNRGVKKVLIENLRRSDVVAWREQKSQKLFGFGQVIPDLAFWDFDGSAARERGGRDTICITMRYDRPFPSEQWLSGVSAFAQSIGSKIVVTNQVRRDNERSKQLAERLGGEFDPWPSQRCHADQETWLKQLYQSSHMMISDRLHGLIAAGNYGAIPVGVATGGSRKVAQHFAVIGLDSIETDVEQSKSLELQLAHRVLGVDELISAFGGAKARLHDWRIGNLSLEPISSARG